MISNSIRFVSVFSATLLAIGSLTGTLQIADAQENQTAANETAQVEAVIDQLLLAQPVLSELMGEEDTGVIQYLNELDTQDAVHTVLALKALQSLIELQSSYEGLGNQTGAMRNQTAAVADNQIGP